MVARLKLKEIDELVKAPQSFEVWTRWVVDILRSGKEARPESQLIALYEELIGCKLHGSVMGMYDAALAHLEHKFASSGYCSSRMLAQPNINVVENIKKEKRIFCC